tara:strand:+ start:2250 stop:3374 length:1125 start_codon:yes stop_codon:yes gene_type:complete
MNRSPKVVISGGGTGGHIFPAISIAQEINKRYPQAWIQFIGANNRMEMSKIPESGFPIIGINIAGFQRKSILKNLSLPIKILLSLFKVYRLLKKWKPDAVVGTGGYVSGPSLFAAQKLSIPTLIQEQNSFAGLTNRLVSRKANAICVAYPEMEKFFPAKKVKLTGNPIRSDISKISLIGRNRKHSDKAKKNLGFDSTLPLVLVLGGSQGAKAINDCVELNINSWNKQNIQILWQCGSLYFQDLSQKVFETKYLKIKPFLNEMDKAYLASDIIISRAGAGSISEICCTGSASILIPSPNVAEDHQTKNAQNLADRDAAIYIDEANAKDQIGQLVINLIGDEDNLEQLRNNALKISQPYAAQEIVNQLEKCWSWKK